MQENKPLGYRTVEVTWWDTSTKPAIDVPEIPVTTRCILSPQMYPGAEQPNDSLEVRDQLKCMIAIRDLGSLRQKDAVIIISVEPVCNCGPGGCKYDNGERFFIETNKIAMLAGHWNVLIDAGRAQERGEDWSARRIAEGRPDVLELALTALRREHNHR
jgi:hypothetical protein